MKKRAQPPDSHTYTTLLRGLAAIKYPQNQSRALSIYSSMFAENSPVKPTIIHTNAMLKVCAYQGDIDCLFGLAAKLPTKGRGAPDNWTYTTILNAIRNQLWMFLQENSENAIEQRERKRQEALLQGRRIWGDIVERWRSGEVSVDEQLVCSMGRLLLLGSRPEDFDDVLSLVEQTMGIPRQIPRIGHPDRVTHHRPVGAKFLEEGGEDASIYDTDHGEDTDNIVSSTPSTVDSLAYSQAPGSEFNPLPASYRSFAKPSRNTLSLVLDACVHMRLSTVSNTYRKILTSPDGEYRIRPDIENLHMYLRILRQSRSSRNAVTLVESMIADPPLGESVQVKTFRIAMSCCVRDRANPAILGHATKLLRMMINTLEEPDFKVSEMFVEIIAQKEIPWRDTLEGLREVEKIIRNFRSLLAYGSFSFTTPESISGETATREEAATYNAEADLDGYAGASETRKLGNIRPSKNHPRRGINEASRRMFNAFATCVVGAYDRLLNNACEEISIREKRECQANKHRLQAWVTRDANRREEMRSAEKSIVMRQLSDLRMEPWEFGWESRRLAIVDAEQEERKEGAL